MTGQPAVWEADVVIVGAGPVGLMLANILGQHDRRVLLLEQLPGLIDYPRGVGMDDECLRAFQAVGLVDAVLPHTTPNHWMRFVTATGRVFASVEPRTDEFGWPRRNAFIQPLADRVLLEGLSRYPNVQVRFGHSFEGAEAAEDGVRVSARDPEGALLTVTARYLVGCDGGRSAVRKSVGISFEGKTESTRWLVVDASDDPVGTPDLYLHCDPRRPTVSIALPHGIRRWEFMVFAHETDEAVTSPETLRTLLAAFVPQPEAVRLIRARVYIHHARLAARFRHGRVLLAGDAAHLMPVWQGQGYNSGIRDAVNLGWKLAAVLRGLAGDGLLDTYEQERRDHAAAMMELSVLVGRIFSPTKPWLARLRDIVALGLNAVPAAKRYVVQMRFKPMPRYKQGALLPGAPKGVPDGRRASASPVGRMFPQPPVLTQHGPAKLDEALGPWFALLGWGGDPRCYMSAASRAFWDNLGARAVIVVPETQLALAVSRHPEATVVADIAGRLKEWFGAQAGSVAILRPDRFLAALCGPQDIDAVTQALAPRLAASLRRTSAIPAMPMQEVVS